MAHLIGPSPTHWLILGVALAGLLLTALGLAAWRRSRNRNLLFVTAAFLLMAAKGLISFYSLTRALLDVNDLELVHSMLDFGMALLFLAPFVWRIRA